MWEVDERERGRGENEARLEEGVDEEDFVRFREGGGPVLKDEVGERWVDAELESDLNQCER